MFPAQKKLGGSNIIIIIIISPSSALDVDRMKEHELYHSAPCRH
jgi:hypothetical protein